MPRGNGTGPNGRGPLTGRGLGNCVGPRGRRVARPQRPIRPKQAKPK